MSGKKDVSVVVKATATFFWVFIPSEEHWTLVLADLQSLLKLRGFFRRRSSKSSKSNFGNAKNTKLLSNEVTFRVTQSPVLSHLKEKTHCWKTKARKTKTGSMLGTRPFWLVWTDKPDWRLHNLRVFDWGNMNAAVVKNESRLLSCE